MTTIITRYKILLAALVWLVPVAVAFYAIRQDQVFEQHLIPILILWSVYIIAAVSLTGMVFKNAAKSHSLRKPLTADNKTTIEYFRAIVESFPGAALLLDAEGRVLYQSASVSRVSGYNFDEIKNLNALDLVHPDEQESVRHLLDWLLESPGMTLRTEHRFMHKDGHYIWLEGAFANLVNDKLNAIVLYYNDISHLKKKEEETAVALREKLATLNRISESVISLDNEWRYTFFNDAALLTHPLGKEGTIGKLLWEVHPELNSPFYKEKFLHAKATNCEVKFENFSKTFNKWFAIKIFPSEDGITVFYNDVTPERTAELKVKESEARLNEAQAIGRIGSWETDLRSSNLVWSLETYKIFEQDHNTFQPTYSAFLEFVHEDDREQVDKAFRDSVRGQLNMLEHRIITKTGAFKWLEERWFISEDFSSAYGRAVGTCQDITERKRSEEERRKTEFELKESQRLAQLGSWNFDLEANKLTWSDELYHVFGTTRETFVETHGSFLSMVLDEDREHVILTSRQAREQGTGFSIEYRIKTDSGAIRTISEKGYAERGKNGQVTRLFGTAQNITERKKIELEIKAEKVFSDAVIQGLPGIFYLYSSEGKFHRWNKNFETVSGYSAEEIKTMHPRDFFDDDQKEMIMAKVRNVFATGKDETMADLYTKDKTKIPYFFNGYRIQLEDNLYLIGMGIDISERVRGEEALASYATEIKKLTAHLEKIREGERTRIAREIHDELGQQLTGLKMDVEWIAKKISPPEKILQKFTEMISLIDQTVVTVRRIVSELRPGVLDDLGLVAALEWQCKEFEKRTGITCEMEIKLKYMSFGQELSINLFRIYQEALTNIARHAKATHVQTMLEEISNTLILSISDNGIGFQKEKAEAGNSWGLVGMRERAALFKGEFSINSQSKGGTIVQIKIPIQNTTV